jgi:hypothetical protein
VTPTKPQLTVLRQALAARNPTPIEARMMLRRVLHLVGGDRRYRQLIGHLRELGDESLADQLEWFIAEYKMRSTKPIGKTRDRPKQREEDDILLLLLARQRWRCAPPGKKPYTIIVETVNDAKAPPSPVKLRGSTESIARRLFALLRQPDSQLPFDFADFKAAITPYRRSLKGSRQT